MSALVRIGPGLNGGYLRLGMNTLGSLGKDMRSIRLPAGEVTSLSGASAGMPIADGEIAANQHVLIRPHPVPNAVTYQVVTSYNPKLLEYGTVSCPPVLAAEMSSQAALHFHANRKLNINDMEYIFEFFQLS